MKHDGRLSSMEYFSVLSAAAREGWLAPLVEAHATPCTQDQAMAILETLALPNMPIRFTNRRGHAYFSNRLGYRLSLPFAPGGRWARLRVGIVLHEAAHVLDHLQSKSFGHGAKFQRQLRRALATDWRELMPTSSFREIFGRHRGPYSIMLSRLVPDGKKTVQKNEHLAGPYSAEEAHEEARMLVADPRENVQSAYIYSESEGQFIGACYNRGETYRPWAEERAEALAAAGFDDVEPAKPAPEPVNLMDALKKALPKEEKPKPAPVEKPLAKAAGQVPTPPKKVMRPLQVAPGAEEKWPKSEPNQVILALFKSESLTAKDAAERLGPKLIELGMAHPASAISRLKQNGLLVEVSE